MNSKIQFPKIMLNNFNISHDFFNLKGNFYIKKSCLHFMTELFKS